MSLCRCRGPYRRRLAAERVGFALVVLICAGVTARFRLWHLEAQRQAANKLADTGIPNACGRERAVEDFDPQKSSEQLDFSKQFVDVGGQNGFVSLGAEQLKWDSGIQVPLEHATEQMDDSRVGHELDISAGSVSHSGLKPDSNNFVPVAKQETILDKSDPLPAQSPLVQVQLFWRKGSGRHPGPSTWDVTLTTQLGLNRLDRLELLTKRWRGPVSATILVCSRDDLSQVEAWHAKAVLAEPETLGALLDIHIAVASEPDPYPVNALRNLARKGLRGRAGLELIVDADAWVVGDMAAVSKDVQNALQNGIEVPGDSGKSVVFCLPSFEMARPGSENYPVSREELETMYGANTVRAMHPGRRSYSGPFHHGDWVTMKPPEPKVLHYEVMYEPYFVVRSRPVEESILFPEQFVGRGFNKQALHFELFAAEYTYVTLASSFVVDMAHHSRAWSHSSKNVQENQGLWNDFRRSVAEKYGLECRDEDWARCDSRGVGCHRVCQERRDNRQKVRPSTHKLHQHKRRPQGSEENKPREDIHWKLYREMLASRTRSGERHDTIRDIDGRAVECYETDANGIERPRIDVVFTWVNGSDPAHVALQRQFIPQSAFDEKLDVGGRRKVSTNGDLAFRFRDFGQASTLRYSLRSLQAFAPWVNRIWIVTAGGESQRPTWLDSKIAKDVANIEFISHEDIFEDPESQLPTFNSCAIESRIHRIKGLAQCYLYMNDDFFLTKPLPVEDLLDESSKLPIVYLTGERAPRVGRDTWQAKVATVAKMVHEKLDLRWEHIFSVGHHGVLFVKPVVEHIMDQVFTQEFSTTAAQRWRQQSSVWLPFVYNNFLAWRYSTLPRLSNAFYFSLTTQGGSASVDAAFQRISEGNFQWACFNDLAVEFTQEMERALLAGFDQLFPQKPSYEV